MEGDPYNQPTTIKRSDGSVLYDVAFRSQTEDQIRTLAAEACMSFNSVHMEGFDEMSQTQIQAFDSFIKYAQSQGTTVILVLSPWHPYLYGYLLTEPEMHKGFFQVENWLRQQYSAVRQLRPRMYRGLAGNGFLRRSALRRHRHCPVLPRYPTGIGRFAERYTGEPAGRTPPHQS